MFKGYHRYDLVSQHLYHSLYITFLEDVPLFDAATIPANLDGLPHTIPLFDSSPVQVLPASAARAPLNIYTRCALPSASLLDSSSVSGTSPSHLVSILV